MITQLSGIRRLFAANRPIDEKSHAGQSGYFVSRLGDVKVETKEGGHTEVIDGPQATDRYAS